MTSIPRLNNNTNSNTNDQPKDFFNQNDVIQGPKNINENTVGQVQIQGGKITNFKEEKPFIRGLSTGILKRKKAGNNSSSDESDREVDDKRLEFNNHISVIEKKKKKQNSVKIFGPQNFDEDGLEIVNLNNPEIHPNKINVNALSEDEASEIETVTRKFSDKIPSANEMTTNEDPEFSESRKAENKLKNIEINIDMNTKLSNVPTLGNNVIDDDYEEEEKFGREDKSNQNPKEISIKPVKKIPPMSIITHFNDYTQEGLLRFMLK